MLKSLHLENFKAFGHRTIVPMAPITLIFGENSSGKSSILQSLNLLKQTRESRDAEALLLPRSERGFVDLGSFQEVLFDHDLERTLKIRVEFALERESGAIELHFGRHHLEETINLERLEVFGSTVTEPDRPVLRFETFQDSGSHEASIEDQSLIEGRNYSSLNKLKCVYITEDEKFWLRFFERAKRIQEGGYSREIGALAALTDQLEDLPQTVRRQAEEAFNFYNTDFTLETFTEWARRQVRDRSVGLDGCLPTRRGIQGIRSHSILSFLYILLFDDVGEEAAVRASRRLDQLLESLFPMGPNRRPPSRWYIHTGTSSHDVGYEGEMLPNLLLQNEGLVDEVNDWLKRLEIGYRLDVVPVASQLNDLFEVRLHDLRRTNKDIIVTLMDVGFGISQILPFIVQSLADSERIISIEQPEVHIHPRLQADIGDLLATATKAPYNNQFLIETHSEHLVLRMQRLVRERMLGKEDIAIIYVSRGENGSRVQRLRLDEEGDFIDDWPHGFFEERLRELL